MSNTFGNIFKITTWGESHGKALGVVIDGCPSNLEISESDIQKELDKRKPGQSNIVSPRKETDKVEILSGVFEGKTLGSPISLIIYNDDQKSKDYDNLKNIFRPGHADFTYQQKYGIRDHRGGGRQSARETVGRVAAGAIAKKYLKSYTDIQCIAYVKQVGKFSAEKIDLKEINKNPVKCPDKKIAVQIEKLILEISNDGDSIGGLVEIVIKNCPIGLGEPVFNKINAQLASGLISINGVKSFEIGTTNICEMKGSEYNDSYLIKDEKIRTKTNNHGGILGGITTGEDIIIRIGVKPTSSISKMQNTVNIQGNEQQIEITGRHDPCLAPRLVPIAEAMTYLVLVDNLLLHKRFQS